MGPLEEPAGSGQPGAGRQAEQGNEFLPLGDLARAKLATSMNGARFCFQPPKSFEFQKRRETVEDSLLVNFALALTTRTLYCCDMTVRDGEQGAFYDLSSLRVYVVDEADAAAMPIEGKFYSLKPGELRFSKLRPSHWYEVRFEGDDPFVGAKMPDPPTGEQKEPERNQVRADTREDTSLVGAILK